MWFGIAGKLQLAIEAHLDREHGAGDEKKDGPGEVVVELSNQEARVLGRHLLDVPGEQFGRNVRTGEPALPPLGTLDLMLQDLAGELGIQRPKPDEEEDLEKT
jgi:hypothetical protein